MNFFKNLVTTFSSVFTSSPSSKKTTPQVKTEPLFPSTYPAKAEENKSTEELFENIQAYPTFTLQMDHKIVASSYLDGTCQIDWDRVDNLATLPFIGNPATMEHTMAVSISKLLQAARNKGRSESFTKYNLPDSICTYPTKKT